MSGWPPLQHTKHRHRERSLVWGQSVSAGKASLGERCKLLYSSCIRSPSCEQMFRNLQTIVNIPCYILFDFYSAAALLAMQSAVIPTAISSVCPSVRPSHAGTLSRRMNVGSRGKVTAGLSW